MKTLTIRIDDNVFIKLNRIAIDNNQSMNKVVNKLIEETLLKPTVITNCIEEFDHKLNDIYSIIDKIDKRQRLHYKISKQHFANRAFLSNADVNEDKCLREILKKDNSYND